MKLDRLLFGGLLFALASTCAARDLSQINPPFPRIGNCYAAGLGSKTWEQGSNYWSKLSLIIGGGYDLHYDWEKPHWAKKLETVEQNIAKLRQANPNVLVLPYVDVIEGPDNPDVPKHWWALKNGERWSGWPGYFRINTDLTEVLQFNLDKVRTEICGRGCFDGVFYDCWKPDDWLVPRTAALRDGKAVVMLNDWNLPRKGFATLNGVLAEDEINRVIEGKVDFENFLGRYLRWTRESRKPVVTMIVCRPQSIGDDAFRWHKLRWKERQAIRDRARTGDEKTMRFGLTTTLMGDGYFGYDTGTMGRGNWWWYREYDAPLGHPLGPARRNADGTWQRDYDGGTVVVNGTPYDVVALLPAKHRDVSTGRVGTRFTIPSQDGRIFLPTTEPMTTAVDIEPRVTAAPPPKLRVAKLDNGIVAAQTPGGLDIRFDATGALRHALWHGRPVFTGGWPVITSPPNIRFHPENVSGGIVETSNAEGRLAFRGVLVESGQRVDFVETCVVRPDNRFTLCFDFTAATDLNLRLWRHYFAFPIPRYANATARTDAKLVTLPAMLKDGTLLPASKRVVIETADKRVTIESSISMSLVDHRKHGSEEYLLAGYPVHGAVKQGTKWSVEISATVAAK
ncbi:MAG: putative glycoside hydrolase [Verrucomicrobia bacterium]|nr:putative glycoside hydrolase [Verrucomicrobiota bacterium]